MRKIAFVLLLAASPVVTASEVPADARAVIQAVHDATAKKDYDALSRHMAKDFQWSVAGEGDVREAMRAWKSNPKYLRNLLRVTSRPCGIRGEEIVECPAKAGKGFRAGFEKTPQGWRMTYFVEGGE